MDRNEPLSMYDERIREIVRRAGAERSMQLGWMLGGALAAAAQAVRGMVRRVHAEAPRRRVAG